MNFEVPPEKLVHIFESYQLRTRAEEIEYLQRTFEDELCLLEALQSSKHTGVTDSNVSSRKEIYGCNSQVEPPGPTFCNLYLQTYRDYPIKLLLLLALALIVVSSIVKLNVGVDWAGGLSIVVAVQLSILVSVLNNLYKVHIFKKLTKNYEQLRKVTVVRDGSQTLIHPCELVVGDVCIIDTYQVLPCDGLLLQELQVIQTQKETVFNQSGRFSSHANLQDYGGLIIDETPLGRKEAARKASLSYCVREADIAPSDCNKTTIPSPVLIAGTTIIKGSGRMVVLAVGENSSKARNTPESKQYLPQSSLLPATPLQTDLLSLSSKLSLYGKIMAATLVVAMFMRFLLTRLDTRQWNLQEDLSKSFEIVLLGSCILVLSVPQGLPLSVTISIAYSLESIFADGSLIRNIEACQTIGLVTDLVLDKEGLLVEDRLRANSLFSFEMQGMLEVADGLSAGPPKGSVEFKEKLGLCLMNKVCLDQSRWIRIEQAFRQLALYYKIRPHPVLSRHSVDASRSVISIKYILLNNKKINVLKGQTAKLLQFCKYVFDEGCIKQMTANYREDILLANRRIELKGESSILLAYNEGKGVVFLALVGMQEQAKPNINSSLQKLESSGIHCYVLMKQGQNLSEAFISKIGLRLNNNREFMDGKAFFQAIGRLVCKSCRVNFCDCPYDIALAKNMDVEPKIDTVANKQAFLKLVDSLAGLYNCGPREKYALVVGLRDIGRLVAVTSNTYEDKLTLSNSDVGFVSNGSSYKHDLGQVGGINLLESNMEAIIKSILWGRNVICSVQKFLVVHLTANVVAIAFTIYCGLIWQEGVLKPMQLLWINLLIDNLAAMALATQPRREHLSEKLTQYNLVSRGMKIRVIVLIIYQLLLLIFIYTFGEWFLPEFPDAFDAQMKASKRDPFFNKYNALYRPRLFMRSGRRYTLHGQPDYLPVERDLSVESRHLTFIFNLFVTLQIFNFISSRKVHKGATVLESFKKNRTFLALLVGVLIAQYLFITFGGTSLQVYRYGLTPHHWLICIAFGLVQLVITGLISLGQDNIRQTETGKEIVNYRLKSSKIKPRGKQGCDYRSSLLGAL